MNENTKTSMENAIGEIKVSQKSDIPTTKYDKTDSLFTIMYILLGYGFVRYFILDFYYENFHFTLPLYTAVYILTVLMYAKRKGIVPHKEAYFWMGVMLCVAFLFKIENFYRLVIQTAVAAYFTAMIGGMYGGGTSGYIWADGMHAFLGAPFAHFVSIFPAFFNLFKKKDKREKVKISPVVYGIVMAVAALWFIMPLLIKADNNFLSGISDFINRLISDFNPGYTLFTIAVHTMLTVPVACYLYSLSYSSVNNSGRLFDKDELDKMRGRLRISPALTLKVFLYIVCFVYLLFIMLQAEYLLGVFMGRLYGGMTYAQYARTGFFELCKVSVINLSLLVIANLLIKQDENKAIKLPMAVLCVLSLLLLSTATAKMAMYISVYGLTVKRVISTVFLLWLVVVFVLCTIRIYRPFNMVKTAVITGAVMFCVLFSFDIGLHSHSFNEKYGFEEQIPEKEYYTGLILPPAESVEKIHCTYFSGDERIEFDIDSPMGIISMLEKATITNKQSVQDFPVSKTSEYYQLDIICPDYDCLTIFIYQDQGYYYAEQPYQAICSCNYDWNEIFSNYYEVTI